MAPKKRKSGSIDTDGGSLKKQSSKKKPNVNSKASSSSSYKMCPYTNEKIWITTVTLVDLKKGAKKKTSSFHKNRKELIRIPSFQQRQEIYEKTAHALECKELACLPLYGKRQWSVSVSIAEDTTKKPPLFRWYRGTLELAVLPHLVEKIPDPPPFHGRCLEYAEDEEPSSLVQREISILSQFANNHMNDDYGIPIVTTKWLSPNHTYFYSRKSAWCEMQRLCQLEHYLQKHLHGLGARHLKLHATYLSQAKILELGKIRFLRDGLWVVGQEDSWQQERTLELTMKEEQEQERNNETCLLQRPLSGLQWFLRTKRDSYRQEQQRKWSKTLTLRQAEQELREIWKTLDKEQQKEWKRCAKQQVCMTESTTTTSLAQQQEPNVEPLQTKEKLKSTTSLVAAQKEPENPNVEPQQTKESANNEMDGGRTAPESLVVVPHETSGTLVSPSPPLLDPSSLLSLHPAIAAAQGEVVTSDEQKRTRVTPSPLLEPDHDEEETTLHTSSHGTIGNVEVSTGYTSMANPVSDKQCVTTTSTGEETIASSRFLMWMPVDKASPGDMKKKVSNTDCTTTNKETTFSIHSSVALLAAPGDHDDKCSKNWERGTTNEDIFGNQSVAGDVPPSPGNTNDKAVSTTTNEEIFASHSMTLFPLGDNAASTGSMEKTTVSNTTNEETLSSNSNNDGWVGSDESSRTAKSCALVPVVEMVSSSGITEMTESSAIIPSATSTASFSIMPVKKKRRKTAPCPTRRPSAQWKLSPEHIDLCYNAAMNHFEMVMNTVKARALHAELQDGFDLLRERGRGRYDMELPIFDTDAFSFLNNLEKTAWMPIVRQVLGPDVVLIHKGVFLSMPGAEAQVYHQDGTHLSSKTQRPCHAVNVFIPLVDLHSRNGPTEFCLGSHILDHDCYDPNRVTTPFVPAGTPIMFDYRLGHRGMSNSSSSCRPIVYCTYAAASANGKEFRDSVNFSRKRYHAIGELVEKPLSREERIANRRKRASEAK